MNVDQMPPKKILETVSNYLEERFGLESSLFSGYGFYLASKGRVYLGPKHAISKPKIVTIGLLVARISNSVKPSTNLFQAFGLRISKNFISLSREQAISYAKGEDLRLEKEQINCTDGYVLLKYDRFPLGCGLLQRGFVKNMLPKAKRLEIKHI